MSVIGRWEYTPTIMPVLDRMSSIEDEPGEFVQPSAIRPADLVPEAEEYRFGPGDSFEVRIRDFFDVGKEEPFERVVDSRGYIDIPRLPPIRVLGRTQSEIARLIEDTIRAERINDRAVVSIQIRGQRKQTFSVLGATRDPGTYYVPAPDYRLLEGITTAGGIDESIAHVYVIRQVYLSDEAAGIVPATEPAAPLPGRPRPVAPTPDRTRQPDEDLIQLIDELSKPSKEDEKPNPALYQPAPAPAQTRVAPAAPSDSPPPIDLPDSAPAPSRAPGAPSTPTSGWVYVDGKWVKSVSPEATESVDGRAVRSQVTQRVIKVPTAPLLQGVADVNIVIRPGDVIRIPPSKSGLVYMTGQVARPGPYSLPLDGKLTLLRAIDSAGGLNSLGIPERVDLTRRLSEDRQATIRLNLRAIAEQTQPDIYLKPDDRINVGTNFFAYPIAVLRSGFRMSYGFGFILDRNFATDVFGVDPSQSRF